MKLFILILCIFLCGCQMEKDPMKTTACGSFTITTVEHDGHKFVVVRGGSGVAVMLHPEDK